MNIVGFGDSFITGVGDNNTYLGILKNYFNAQVITKGIPGTGPWEAFFQFKKYTGPMDVAIFAWSEPHRLYHSRLKPVDWHNINRETPGYNDEVKMAAEKYYQFIYDQEKAEHEAEALYHWFDEYSKRFNVKFIHLWSFAKNPEAVPPEEFYNQHPGGISYHHRFNNGVEIRPALMKFSVEEEWPGMGNIRQETRPHHMGPHSHHKLSKLIIDAIENYEPGRLIECY